jgi:beta-glucanase (GH16 family)
MIQLGVRGHSRKGFEGYIGVWIDGVFAYYLDSKIIRTTYGDALKDAENLRNDLIKENYINATPPISARLKK